MDVRLFGANVLVDQVARNEVELVLPETAKSQEAKALYRFVAVRIGPDVDGISEGDEIIPATMFQAHQIVPCDIGDGMKNFFLVDQRQIGGVVV